jgi:hypothetical protein
LNEIVFPISFSAFSSLANRKATAFYVDFVSYYFPINIYEI